MAKRLAHGGSSVRESSYTAIPDRSPPWPEFSAFFLFPVSSLQSVSARPTPAPAKLPLKARKWSPRKRTPENLNHLIDQPIPLEYSTGRKNLARASILLLSDPQGKRVESGVEAPGRTPGPVPPFASSRPDPGINGDQAGRPFNPKKKQHPRRPSPGRDLPPSRT